MLGNGTEREAKLRRKRRSRQAKFGFVLVMAVVIAVGGWLLATRTGAGKAEAPWSHLDYTVGSEDPSSQHGTGADTVASANQGSSSGSSLSSTETSKPRSTSTTTPPGRQIAAIVYLEGKGLPKGTLEALEGLHATEVYLYVAYYSDAYYSIPKNTSGMALPADNLRTAVKQLHDAGYRVFGVISTALLDWRQAPPEGLAILQSAQKPIFDPVKAGPFVEQLTRSLVEYPLDGIYVGEPYWLTPTSDDTKKLDWNDLYERLLAITQKAGIPFHMIMPTFNGYYTLHSSFAELPFHTIGMDAEFAWYTEDRETNLGYFQQLIDITKAIAKGRDALIEVNLHQGLGSTLQSTPVPIDFFREELKIARESRIKRVVIFAAVFWDTLPNKNEYSSALAEFVAP